MAKETHPDIRRTLLFLRRGDEILLAMKKRGFGAGLWNGVGGKLEAGETLNEATIRETQEEIGVTPTRFSLVAEHDFVQDSDNDPWHMYVYAYICNSWEGEPTESEEMRPKWFNMSAIPYDEMWEDDKLWLPQILADEKVAGTFVFNENNKLISHTIKTVNILPIENNI